MADNSKRIILGSGKLYCVPFSGDVIPENATIETEQNILGLISGGAAVKYEAESYTASDDLGIVKKTQITAEDVSLETGVLTWNGKTLEKLCSTARVTEDTSKHTRTVKIGGVANMSGTKYLFRFVHNDVETGAIRLTMVATADEGFEFTFAKDEETTLDVTLKALPCDKEGTLLIFTEDDASVTA